MKAGKKYKQLMKELQQCVEGDFEKFGEVFADSTTGETKISPDDLLPFCNYIMKNNKPLIDKFEKRLDKLVGEVEKKIKDVERFMIKYEARLSLITKLEMSFYMSDYKNKMEGLTGIGAAFLVCCGRD